MLPEVVLRIADDWWARDFGCRADELRPEVARVQRHASESIASSTIWILVVGEHPLVSLPPRIYETFRDRARSWSPSLVADASALATQLAPVRLDRIVGPAFIGYATRDTLRPPVSARTRQLTASDSDAVARLRATCSSEEWEHGASDRNAATFGAFDESDRLCALAGYDIWGAKIAHLYVIAAADRRNGGFGASAATAAAIHAMDVGLVPQYRTLISNLPSRRVAEKLGFERYGFSVAVRLAGSDGLL